MRLRCGSLSITTPVSLLANESDVRSVLHGQVREKSGNFEVDIEWQPCTNTYCLNIFGINRLNEKGYLENILCSLTVKDSIIALADDIICKIFNIFKKSLDDKIETRK